MTKTIAQLWNGALDPARHSGQYNQEIREVELLLERNLSKLQAALNPEEKELLAKYTVCVEEYLYLTDEQSFCDGFCIGARLTAEALAGSEQLT